MRQSSHSEELRRRLEERIGTWGIVVDRIEETETSLLAFGSCGPRPVVLKLIKDLGDEWHSGDILNAFEGNGVVRVFEHVPGAMLLEQLSPGTSLASLALNGDDDEATRALATVIGKMSPRKTMTGVPTVEEWGKAFERYDASGEARIPRDLLREAHRLYAELCRSQSQRRLLHGDLHHANVLFDTHRGWLAIDPKGVIGELAYELGAALRNPVERPTLFTDPPIIEKRVQCFAHTFDLNTERILAWAFAQAVLSVIWMAEDGLLVDSRRGELDLAEAIRPMLKHGS